MSPQKIEVKEGAETQVELRLPVYGRIEGRIVDAYTGAPVANADVIADIRRLSIFSRSDAEGKYSIEVIPGKCKRIGVMTKPQRYVYGYKEEFIVEEGQTVRIDIELIEGATIMGRVVIPGGIKPEMHARLLSKEAGFSTEIKSDGTYQAEHIPPGRHTVRLEVYNEEKGKTETLMEKVVEVKDKEAKTGVDFVVVR
jgi:hypothetical protein